MLASLAKLPPKAVVILHPAAHNPTGADPSKEEWAAIADAMDKGRLFPFFDCAYQVVKRMLAQILNAFATVGNESESLQFSTRLPLS